MSKKKKRTYEQEAPQEIEVQDTKFLDTLSSLNTAAHHFVMSGIICFMRNLILEKRAEYLKDGAKHKLWKNANISKEMEILNSDMKKITGNTVNTLNDNNLYESLYKMSNFVVTGYSRYFSVGVPDKQRIYELLKGKKDKCLSIWLRFYFRFRGAVEQAETESDDVTRYIG